MLVDALWRTESRKGEGPLDQLRRVARTSPTLTLASLDRLSSQLVQYLAVLGPRTRPELAAEAVDGDLVALDGRIERMATVGIVRIIPAGHLDDHPDEPRLDLVEPFTYWAPSRLPSIRRELGDIRSAELRKACSLLGLRPDGTDKTSMLDALLTVLLDKDQLTAAVQAAHPDGEHVFVSVLDRSASTTGRKQTDPGNPCDDGLPGVVSIVDLWQALEDGRGFYTHSATFQVVRALQDRCIIGGQGQGPGGYGYGAMTWAWIETVVGLTGHMFRSWADGAGGEVDPRPIDEPVGTPASVVVATGLIAERLAEDRTEGKRTGDRRPPVKAIRRAGAELGLSAPLAGLLADAAIGIGILAPIDVRSDTGTGRRRTITTSVQWVLDPTRFAQWTALPPADRWLRVVRTWLHPEDGAGSDLLAFGARTTAIAALASLPEGNGVGAADLVPWLSEHHGTWARPDEDVIRDLALLGVTSSGPVVGLGRAGRAMLATSMSAAEVAVDLHDLFDGDGSIVVQPDHTVICAADAPVEVLEMLTRIAERESHGAATVWRLSTRRLVSSAKVLDADTVIGFLTDRSSVPITTNVERLIRDNLVANRSARIEAVSSMVTCEDPAVLSSAVAVKAAELRPLTETIAVSPLEPAKLRDALRAKHVPTDLLGLDGEQVVLGQRPEEGELARSWQARVVVPAGPVRSPGPVPIGPAVVASYVGLVTGDHSRRGGGSGGATNGNGDEQ